jgi:hypothetical protein
MTEEKMREMLLLLKKVEVLAEGNPWREYLLRCLAPAKAELQRQLKGGV